MKKLFGHGLLVTILLGSSLILQAAAERENALQLNQDLQAACAAYDFQEIIHLLRAGAVENMNGHSLLEDYILGSLPEDVVVMKVLMCNGADVKSYGDSLLMWALQTEEPLEQKKAKVIALASAGARTSIRVIQKNVETGLIKTRAAKQRGTWHEGLLTREQWRELVQVIVDNVEDFKNQRGIMDYLMQEHKAHI